MIVCMNCIDNALYDFYRGIVTAHSVYCNIDKIRHLETSVHILLKYTRPFRKNQPYIMISPRLNPYFTTILIIRPGT